MVESYTMKDRLTSFAKGIIDVDTPEIKITPELFEYTAAAGTELLIGITLESLNGKMIKGLAYSDEPRLSFDSGGFMGRLVHITARLDTAYTEQGMHIRDRVCLVTNGGEFSVPFDILIKEENSICVERPAAENPCTESAAEEELFELLPENGSDTVIPDDVQELEDTAARLIREQAADENAFRIYEAAVKRGTDIAGLFEAYVYAWPAGKKAAMPREVLLYFLYSKTADEVLKSRVYSNVLEHFPPEGRTYREFEPDIRSFAVESMLKGRMSGELKVIYDRVLYPGMIDKRTARVLPDLLMLHRITADRSFYAAAVSYNELSEKYISKAAGTVCYIPVWFDGAVIELIGEDGRPEENIKYSDEKLFDRPELLKRSYDMYPEHPMLMLSRACETVKKGIENQEEADLLRSAMELPLSVSFRNAVIESLCEFGGDPEWIRELELSSLSPAAMRKAVKAMVGAGDFSDAYRLLRLCGQDRIETDILSALARGLVKTCGIPVSGRETDRFFVLLLKKLYDRQCCDPMMLEILAETYEGSSGDMYSILMATEDSGAGASELAAKLLASMLFSGASDGIDNVFAVYLKDHAVNDLLPRAFFTVRLNGYFMHGERLEDSVFEALYGFLSQYSEYEKLPPVYLMAMTKYYSSKSSLFPEEKILCEKLTALLTEQGYVFEYTKKLGKHIQIPQEIAARFYVEYRTDGISQPVMEIMITPDETDYHEVQLRPVYKNIYVMSAVLFAGETMRYRIYEDSGRENVSQEGAVAAKRLNTRSKDRYSFLNRMAGELAGEDDAALKSDMREYALKDAIRRQLFNVGE